MNNELKKISGSVLAIGLDDKQQNILEKNKKVLECYLLSESSNGIGNFKGYSKTINIKKIKKIFRKKRFDYIVGNFNELKPYLRSFIKNSVYLNKGKLYFFNINDFEMDELEKRYIRYGADIDVQKDFVMIDNKNSKTNIFKNIFYYMCDLIYDVIDYIGRLLVN